MLKAEGLVKRYGDLTVLKEVSLEGPKGEVGAIVGSSGAGKSTLLHILGTLSTADAGKDSIGGKDVFALNAKELAAFRNEEIGLFFSFIIYCLSLLLWRMFVFQLFSPTNQRSKQKKEPKTY